MNRNNYRGISLLDTSYKVLSNVLHYKFKSYEDEVVNEYRGAFIKEKLTRSNIYCQISNEKILRIQLETICRL